MGTLSNYETSHMISHVNNIEIDMKTIGVKITPDQRNLIGVSCLKNFLIENVAFADPKIRRRRSSLYKEIPKSA